MIPITINATTAAAPPMIAVLSDVELVVVDAIEK